jgi:hypothetical protein
MKEKGFEASEPFLVCNDKPYMVGEKDWKMLTKEESSRWWDKKTITPGSSNVFDKAIQMELPELYMASKYIENVVEEDCEESEGGALAEEGGTSEKRTEVMEEKEEDSSSGRMMEVEKGVDIDGPIDLRRAAEVKASSKKLTELEEVNGLDITSGALDLRVVRTDENRRIVRCASVTESRSDGLEIGAMALDLTINKRGGKEEDKQENDKMEVSQGENTEEEGEEKGADSHDSLGGAVGVEEQAREEVDEATEILVKEMAKEDGRNVVEKEVSLQTQSRVMEAEIITEEEEVERGGERETKRKAEGDSRARKRVRQSLKRYRESESESSSSSDETSSSDEEDSSKREMRFTNILSEMIRKTGSIVGEQVIANAGLIKSLQKSVDDLKKEVKELRSELRERKGKNEDRSKENKRPEVREVRGESGPAKAHERKERDREVKKDEKRDRPAEHERREREVKKDEKRDRPAEHERRERDVKKDDKRERPAERERQRKSGGSSRDGHRRVERGRDYIRL